MKKIYLCLIVLVVSVGMISCSKEADDKAPQARPQAGRSTSQASQASAHEKIFKSIPPAEAEQMIAANKELLILDVRSAPELKEGVIEGSEHLPVEEVIMGRHHLPRDRPILLICAIGGRSYAAGQVLSMQGYPEIYNLQGGISAWKKAGLPLRF